MTSLKKSPSSEMIHGGSEIDARPRRTIVRLGSTPVTIAALTAVRLMPTGAGRWAAVRPTACRTSESRSADLKRVAVGLSVPPSVGTNVDPGALRTKFDADGIVATLDAVCPASETPCDAATALPHCRNRRNR